MEGMRKVELLRAACCVAGIDGHTSDAERRILQMLADQVGVGEASLNAMIERAETDDKFYREQFRVLKADPKETMQLLFTIAVADGGFGKDEHHVLERLAARLEVSKAQFDKWTEESIAYLDAKSKDSES